MSTNYAFTICQNKQEALGRYPTWCDHMNLAQGKDSTETALRSWSYKKVFWKYEANLQENIDAEVRFQ